MNFVEILKECESASGGGSKDVIKLALSRLDAPSRQLMWYAQNPFKVFGVRKFAQPTKFADTDPADLSFLFQLLEKLHDREITGDAARSAVTEALSTFTQETASYIERVIDKDLKAGFSEETYNLVLLSRNDPSSVNFKTVDKLIKSGGYSTFAGNEFYSELVPVFKVMLADKCEEVEDFEKEITFPCQADIKYDGTRTIAMVTAGAVDYRARSGKVSEHLVGLFDEELLTLRKKLGYDFILDGEAFASNFTETMNAKKSDNKEAKSALKFRAFFLMPMSDWLNQKTTITMRQNREALTTLLKDGVKVILSEGREVSSYEDMTIYCNEVIDLHKQEGLILKNWDAIYTWDRSFSWCKVKRFYDVDARIVGFYPGRKKSRLENTVGGVNCVAFLESGERVEFNVGSGFDDATRESMRTNPQWWLDNVHVIKYQEVCKAKGKEFSSLRFCTYERSRDDKRVEI